MTRRSVDFPLPLGPSSAVSEPAGTSTETSSSATNSPNRFVTDLATMAISASPPCGLNSVIATSVAIASIASTTEAAYAPV